MALVTMVGAGAACTAPDPSSAAGAVGGSKIAPTQQTQVNQAPKSNVKAFEDDLLQPAVKTDQTNVKGFEDDLLQPAVKPDQNLEQPKTNVQGFEDDLLQPTIKPDQNLEQPKTNVQGFEDDLLQPTIKPTGSKSLEGL